MAQRFKTDFKDEIVEGVTKVWRAVSVSGSILLDAFRMERVNKNTQEGDNFGSKEVNAIHAFLNGLLEGTETVNKAKNADTVNGKKVLTDVPVFDFANVEKKIIFGNTVEGNVWSYIKYNYGLVEAWRYVRISAQAKTNTFALPFPMSDTEYAVSMSPMFNGHLCNSVWCGTLVGADGRTLTTAQVSMDSSNSSSDVGFIIRITGYLK